MATRIHTRVSVRAAQYKLVKHELAVHGHENLTSCSLSPWTNIASLAKQPSCVGLDLGLDHGIETFNAAASWTARPLRVMPQSVPFWHLHCSCHLVARRKRGTARRPC